MDEFRAYLEQSAQSHKNLCPRQVLGVRMGRYAGRLLGFDPLQVKKRLLVIVETDGCFATGVAVATGCSIGSRNLRIEDFGKSAATFTDTRLRRSVRIAPRPDVRDLARDYAPEMPDRWRAMLEGYQRIPDELLFSWQAVELCTSIEAIFSRPGVRTACDVCGEEIINEREVVRGDRVLCRSCAGFSYYVLQSDIAYVPQSDIAYVLQSDIAYVPQPDAADTECAEVLRSRLASAAELEPAL